MSSIEGKGYQNNTIPQKKSHLYLSVNKIIIFLNCNKLFRALIIEIHFQIQWRRYEQGAPTGIIPAEL